MRVSDIKIFTNSDVKSKCAQLERFSDSYISLLNYLFERNHNLKYYQSEIEGKSFRFFLANHSISSLAKGIRIDLLNTEVIDLFSIFQHSRNQIEAFLMMYYLFYDNVPDEEKSFRYDIFKLHGLQKQVSFETSSNDEVITLKRNINLEIGEVIERIKNSRLYSEASPRKQKEYLKPKYARMIKPEVIFLRSGISNLKMDLLWSLYSNFSHSEYIGDRQFNSMLKNQKLVLERLNICIIDLNFLTAKLIEFILTEFPSLKADYLNFDTNLRESISFYQRMANK
jgi:hypothetical protein